MRLHYIFIFTLSVLLQSCGCSEMYKAKNDLLTGKYKMDSVSSSNLPVYEKRCIRLTETPDSFFISVNQQHDLLPLYGRKKTIPGVYPTLFGKIRLEKILMFEKTLDSLRQNNTSIYFMFNARQEQQLACADILAAASVPSLASDVDFFLWRLQEAVPAYLASGRSELQKCNALIEQTEKLIAYNPLSRLADIVHSDLQSHLDKRMADVFADAIRKRQMMAGDSSPILLQEQNAWERLKQAEASQSMMGRMVWMKELNRQRRLMMQDLYLALFYKHYLPKGYIGLQSFLTDSLKMYSSQALTQSEWMHFIEQREALAAALDSVPRSSVILSTYRLQKLKLENIRNNIKMQEL